MIKKYRNSALSIYRYATYYLPKVVLVLIENVNKIAQFAKEVFVRKSTSTSLFIGTANLSISFHIQTIAAPSLVHRNDGAAMRQRWSNFGDKENYIMPICWYNTDDIFVRSPKVCELLNSDEVKNKAG